MVGATETKVGQGNFEFDIDFENGSARSSEKIGGESRRSRRTEVTERGSAMIFGGGAAVIAGMMLKFGAEEGGKVGATGFAEERPEFGGAETAEIAKIARRDLTVLDRGS